MPSHLNVPVGLLDCPISQDTINDPTIAPEGQSFGSGIHTWVRDVRPTNPITRTALHHNQLRRNLWLQKLLTDNRINTRAPEISIPCDLLNNPLTGQPFINPVVNEQGETVEGVAGALYSNLLLKHLCEKKAQLEAAERAQTATNLSSTTSSETAPLLASQRLSVTTAPIATTRTVSLTAPGRTHPMQILMSTIASPINSDDLRGRLEEVWREYDRRIARAQSTADHAMVVSHAAVNLSELASGDAREADRNAHQALSVARRALEKAKQNKGWAIGISATIAIVFATVGAILIVLRYKIFADNNTPTPTVGPTPPPGPTPSPGPTAAPTPSPVPTPSPAPTCIPPRYTVSYSFDVPFVPGGNLCVNNNGNSDISLKGLTFTTNSILNGNPWNGLFPWQSTITRTPNELFNDYSVAMSSNVNIPPSSSACLTYNYNQTANMPMVQAVGMNPTTVGVTFADGSTATLPLQGANPCALNPVPNYGLTAWYPNWGMYATGRNYTVADLPAQRINQVNYAFWGINATTADVNTLDVYADSNQLPALAMLKQQYPYLKTFGALGGYCTGNQFGNLTENQNLINNFATKVADAVDVFQMDGAYIDWEWDGQGCGSNPQPNSFSQLFSTLRSTFDNRFGAGKKLVGINVPAGIDKITGLPNSTWCDVQSNVDYWDVMTYDYGGAFSAKMNYGSPLDIDPRDPTITDPVLKYYDVKSSIQIYQDMRCIPTKKVGIGVPVYGRAANTANVTEPLNGLWQEVEGTPRGQYDTANQSTLTGTFDYRCIVLDTDADCHYFTRPPANLNLIPTDQNVYGNVTMQPWGYAQPNFTLTYDDTTAVQAKAQYVIDEGLNNLFFWDASQDAPSGSGKSLIDAGFDTLNMPQTSAAKRAGLNPTSSNPTRSNPIASNQAASIKRAAIENPIKSVVIENPTANVTVNPAAIPAAIPAMNIAHETNTTQTQSSSLPTANAEANQQSFIHNFIQEKIQALTQLLPEGFRNSALTTASNTALFALLPQALQTAMTYQLNKSGYSKENIQKANLALQAFFALFAVFSSPSSTATAFATSRFISYVMNNCGFSKETSETLATSAAAIAAISVTAATSQFEAIKAAVKVTLLMMGSFILAFDGAQYVLPRLGLAENTTDKIANVVAGTAGVVAAALTSPLTAAATTAILGGSFVGKKAGEKLAQFGIWNNTYIPTDANYHGILIGPGQMRQPRVSTATLMRDVNGTIVALTAREKDNVFRADAALKQVEEGTSSVAETSATGAPATRWTTWTTPGLR